MNSPIKEINNMPYIHEININDKEVTIQKLKEAVRQKYFKMLSDKKQTPTLIIPKTIPSFISTNLFFQYLFSIYDYCTFYNGLLKKYSFLNKKLNERGNRNNQILESDRSKLIQKQRQISIHYSTILLRYSQKSINKDQFFFQTLIYLIGKTLKTFFLRDQFLIIQQQINRLFRTNKYNIIKKRHQNDQVLKKYPILKDSNRKAKINVLNIISKAEQKSKAFKQMIKQSRMRTINKEKQTIQLVSNFQNDDSLQRSPIISTWLPSNRMKIHNFTNDRKFHHSLIERNDQKNGSHSRIFIRFNSRYAIQTFLPCQYRNSSNDKNKSHIINKQNKILRLGLSIFSQRRTKYSSQKYRIS